MSKHDLHTLGYIKIDKNGIFAAKKVSETNDISNEEFKTEQAAIQNWPTKLIHLQGRNHPADYTSRQIVLPKRLRKKEIRGQV